MLGTEILDPDGVESSTPRATGLGVLSVSTRFERDKTTAQVQARVAARSLLGEPGTAVSGYEIHMGAVERAAGARAALEITSRNGAPCRQEDGAVSAAGAVVGTLVHGLFENDAVRAALLGALRARRGLAAPRGPAVPTRDAEYDRLARAVLDSVDWTLLCRIAGVALPRPSFEAAP
jgi:adenosylcobyric acid synthase